jgi:hypothetical protein
MPKIQRNWQHRGRKSKTNKPKTKRNMCWTPLYANKQKIKEMLIANNDIHIHESYKSWIAEIKGQLDIIKNNRR